MRAKGVKMQLYHKIQELMQTTEQIKVESVGLVGLARNTLVKHAEKLIETEGADLTKQLQSQIEAKFTELKAQEALKDSLSSIFFISKAKEGGRFPL